MDKKVTEINIEILETIDKIRRGFREDSRLGLSQLGRSRQWRSNLEEQSALEILDRNQTGGVILSPAGSTGVLGLCGAGT